MKRLEGQVALVTGAARGIGAAIAERLAKDGAAVAINYAKSAEQAEALAERIRASGGRAKALQADLSRPSEARALVEATFHEFDRLDILVNNAATAGFAPIGAVDEAFVRSNLSLNVEGPLFATQATAAHFPDQGGRVINVSSLVATRMLAGASVYAATKSALEALTRVWAAELGPKSVTVNAVAPGLWRPTCSGSQAPTTRCEGASSHAPRSVGSAYRRTSPTSSPSLHRRTHAGSQGK